MTEALGWWGVVFAIFAGAIRISTPYLLVSVGETITEKSGRTNLGLEGTVVLGAMCAFATSYLTGSPWLGVLAAGCAGALLGLVHALICNLPRVNDIAVGIALFLLGVGLAFYFGKPFIEPRGSMLPGVGFGFWSDNPAIRSGLEVNPLFILGVFLAVFLQWALIHTKWGLLLRMAGESEDAARAAGRSVQSIRTYATAFGGSFLVWAARRCRYSILVTGMKDSQRSGFDGDRLSHIRTVESRPLFLRIVTLWGRICNWPRTSECRYQSRILSVQRRAIRPHACASYL